MTPTPRAKTRKAHNPRRANGWRRDKLNRQVKASEDTCIICLRPVDKSLRWPDMWCGVTDEEIPVARGGDPLRRSNCHLAHNWCNQIKGAHSLAWARAEVQRILNGQSKDVQTKPTAIPFKTSGL